MARNRNITQTVTTTTVTRDAVDILKDKLNEIEGIEFERDSWENEAPDDYGVVVMGEQVKALWADNKMVGQIFRVEVHLYAVDGSNAWVGKIQSKLADAADWYNLGQHEYLYDINKNHWMWNAFIIAPLQWDEVVTVGQT